jgi:hypothetical protein
MRIPDQTFVRGLGGHRHGWPQAFSRRQFLGATAAAGGAAAPASLWMPLLTEASSIDPTPIPETIFPGTPFHVQFPLPGNDQSTINNFKGMVASTQVSGKGTTTDTSTGATSPFFFGSDMRFMQGTYIGEDGQTHKGTFVFV